MIENEHGRDLTYLWLKLVGIWGHLDGSVGSASLDFSSGDNLTLGRLSPTLGFMLGMEPA